MSLRRLLAGLLALACAHCAPPAYANATTPNLGLNKPAVGADADVWGGYINNNADILDGEFARTARGDADYSVLSTDRNIVITASLTAPRTFTLPTAASLRTGQVIRIIDEAGGISGTNTLSLARAGADTIDGGTSFVVASSRAVVDLRSDGVSKWTAAQYGAFESGTWTPAVTFTTPGTFSVSYSVQRGSYTRIGDRVFLQFAVVFTPTLGTASGSFLIGGLPYSSTANSDTGGEIASISSFQSFTGTIGLAFGSVAQLRISIMSASGTSAFSTSNLQTGVAHTVAGSIAYKVP